MLKCLLYCFWECKWFKVDDYDLCIDILILFNVVFLLIVRVMIWYVCFFVDFDILMCDKFYYENKFFVFYMFVKDNW